MQKPANVADAKRVANFQFLAFCIGSEEYGVPLPQVQELRSYEGVTQIANAPDFMKGVINLRGSIVPVIDMRIPFGLPASYDAFTVVVILNVGDQTVGMVVGGVSDVVTLLAEQIKPAPAMGSVGKTSHLLGMGTFNDRMLALLDLDQLLADSDIGLISRLAG